MRQQLQFSSAQVGRPLMHRLGPGAPPADQTGTEETQLSKAVETSNAFTSWAKGLIRRRTTNTAPPAAPDDASSSPLTGDSDPATETSAGKARCSLSGSLPVPINHDQSEGCTHPSGGDQGFVPGGSSTRITVMSPPSRPVDMLLSQLSLLTLRSYSQLRDQFKKQLAALLPSCIHLPSGGEVPTNPSTPASEGRIKGSGK